MSSEATVRKRRQTSDKVYINCANLLKTNCDTMDTCRFQSKCDPGFTPSVWNLGISRNKIRATEQHLLYNSGHGSVERNFVNFIQSSLNPIISGTYSWTDIFIITDYYERYLTEAIVPPTFTFQIVLYSMTCVQGYQIKIARLHM